MVKKKEIIFCAFLVIITMLVAFSSKIKELFHKEKDTILEEKSEIDSVDHKYVVLTFTGELLIERVQFEVPYGYNFGNVVGYLDKYTNEFSIVDYDKETRFFEDTNIFIASSDTKKDEALENIKKIQIHTATKEELVSLYGIGEKRADKIIEYRKEKRITSFEELKKIIGVSNEVIESIQKQAIL